ncbi:TolC family protein [Flavobacteriaceae bacterium R38]|nr:TolC family protein [Flavobacteriaceae bacterium R38]
MKLRIAIVVVLMGICFTNAQQKKWTLKECVEYAIENNITIKQSELDLENSKINKSDAVGSFLPTLNGNASHSFNIGLSQDVTTGTLQNLTSQNTSGGLSLGVDIFRGLQNINQLRRSKLALIASQYRLDNIKDDISLAVANNYLQVLFNRESLIVAQAQYAVTEQDLKRTKELVESGVVPKGDLLEIEATAATQEQQIINADNALRLSKIALAQLLLITDYENFDVANEDFLVPTSTVMQNSPRTIFDKALTFRNDIKLSKTNVELAEIDLKLAKGARLPTISGFYNYDTRASDQDRAVFLGTEPGNPIGTVASTGETVIGISPILGSRGPDPFTRQLARNDGHRFGVSLNVPILNGFSARNNVKRRRIDIERSKNQYEQDKLDLENVVNQAWNDTQAALKTYEAAQKTYVARNEAYNYARERFNVGLMNSFDFSQAQSRLENAEAEQIRTKFDYIFKLKILEFYFGIPIYDLN